MNLRNTRRRLLAPAAIGLLTLGLGCDTSEAPDIESGGVALRVDIRGDTDVAGMEFVVQEVDCSSGEAVPGTDPVVVSRDLEDIQLPGGLGAFEDMPLDADSSHVFADAFISLGGGCYDVTTTPLDNFGNASDDCGSATARNVQVTPGQTTQILLINQCAQSGAGAIDAASVLNHAPTIDSVVFVNSKFGLQCIAQEICATGSDGDSDPIEFEWTSTATGGLAFAGPRVDSNTTNDDGSVTECVSINPQQDGQYEFTVTVYDLLRASDGSLVRFESAHAASGNPAESRGALTFPFFSSPEGASPSAEICDGLDNDCDLEVDEFDAPNGVNCVAFGNEDCASAFVLPEAGGVFTGDTSTLANDYEASCGALARSPDAVFSLTVADNPHLITATTDGSSYDTVLHARVPECGPGTEIACNDDGGIGLQSRLDLEVLPGTYFFIVDGFASTRSGPYVINVDASPNESCELAFSVTGTVSSYAGDTTDLTNDHAASCGGQARSNDAVYRLVLPVDSNVVATTAGSSYDTVLHLHDAEACDDTTEVACDDDGGPGLQSELDEDLVAGTYFIVVDGFASTRAGAYTLGITVTPN